MNALKILRFLILLMLTIYKAASADSLYDEVTYKSLTDDRKARRVGDLITIMIYENSSATSAANTSASRDASVAIDLRLPGYKREPGLRSSNETDGRGRTQREGRVLAQITGRVVSINTEGALQLIGEQVLEINNERQRIQVQGTVRREDVSDNNTVLSTRIADAKITYSGFGDVADRQRPGWWQRVLTWFGA